MVHASGAAADARGAVPHQIGSWLLGSKIGDGSWTSVYRARPISSDPHAPADYALKLPRPDQPRGLAERLIGREALVGSQISHPHLMPILAARSTNPAYVVMPYCDAPSLESVLASCPNLPVGQALWIARQVCEAIAALHAGGWLHADVKPANVLVAPSGHTTLIDLGFARKLGGRECRAGGPLYGSPAYTAPERLSPHTTTESPADIYSLGVTLYEMLCGYRPFALSGEDAGVARSYTDPRRWRPDLLDEVAHLLRDVLATEPLRRPSAASLVDQLMTHEIAWLSEARSTVIGAVDEMNPSASLE